MDLDVKLSRLEAALTKANEERDHWRRRYAPKITHHPHTRCPDGSGRQTESGRHDAATFLSTPPRVIVDRVRIVQGG